MSAFTPPWLLAVTAFVGMGVGCSGGRTTSAAEALAVAASQSLFVDFPRANLEVDFGAVDAGLRVTQGVQLWNRGKAEAMVEVVQSPQEPFGLREANSVTLGPGARATLLVDFAPTAVGSFASTLKLSSGDATASLRVKGTGIRPIPAMKRCDFVAGPTSIIDFGLVEPAQPMIRKVYFQNNGEDGCALEFAAAVGAFSVLDLTPGTSFKSFERRTAQVQFAPLDFGKSHEETLIGTPRGEGQPVSLKLRGVSAEACPRFPNDGGCPTVGPEILLNTRDELWKRSSSGQLSMLAAFSVLGQAPSTMTDIAISPAGDLFGVAGPIYSINPLTGVCREIAKPTTTIVGLGFLPDGRMITAGAGLFLIDLTTQPPTESPIPGTSALQTSGDVVALDNDRILWAVSGGDTLVEVRLDAGTVSVVGSIGNPTVYGLAYDIDGLHGFTNGGQELTIDTQTAQVTGTKSLPAAWYGAANRAP